MIILCTGMLVQIEEDGQVAAHVQLVMRVGMNEYKNN